MTNNEQEYLMIENWNKYGVTAGTTTRIGGYSKDKQFKSYNMGFDTGDQAIHKNVKKWIQDFNWSDIYKQNRMFFARQVHMDNIMFVDERAIKFNNCKDHNSTNAHYGIDGFITNLSGDKQVVLSVITADCQPIFVLDPKNKATAILHAGWKGTKLRILERAVNFMKDFYGSNTKDILVHFGVCISPERYEVSEDFKSYFNRNLIEKQGKLYFDINGENTSIAQDIGIPFDNISSCKLCSYDRDDLFYSHRRDKGITGRMRSFISIA